MKDEPRQLHLFRYILYGFIIILYLLYLCYLIYSLVTDKPNIKVDRIFLNEIDVPGKIFNKLRLLNHLNITLN
jgi:hypothetical protein